VRGMQHHHAGRLYKDHEGRTMEEGRVGHRKEAMRISSAGLNLNIWKE